MNQIARLPLSLPEDGFWPGEGAVFTRESLDDLFEWSYRLGASDIRLETHKPVFVQLHGRMRKGHRQLVGWPACEMELSQVAGRNDNVRRSQLRRLSLPG